MFKLGVWIGHEMGSKLLGGGSLSLERGGTARP